MRLVEMEATTFLVRKKSLDPAAFGIQATRFVCRRDIREQMERLLIAFGPATEEHHRAIGGCCDVHLRQRDSGPWLDAGRHSFAAEALPVPHHSDVTPRADDVGPMHVLQGMLQRDAIELPIAQHHHRRPHGEQLVHLLDKRDMQVFGKVSLLAFAHLPGHRQGTSFVDDMHHQGHTAASHDTAINDEHQSVQGQMGQQHLYIRYEINLIGDPVVAHPPGKAFDTALSLGTVGDFRRDVGQLRPLAPDDAADEGGEGRQMPGNWARKLARIPLYEGVPYGTIPAEVVTHRRLLLDWWLSPERVYDRATS